MDISHHLLQDKALNFFINIKNISNKIALLIKDILENIDINKDILENVNIDKGRSPKKMGKAWSIYQTRCKV